MCNGKSFGLRVWMLGGAAAGLVSLSHPAMGQVSNAMFTNPKNSKPAPRATRTTEPPKLLAVPNAYVSPVNATQPADDGKSEVQRQLELLYQQDGREQPNLNMNMNLQPINPAMTNPSTTPAPGTRPVQPVAPPTQKPAAIPQVNRQIPAANASRPQATPYPPQAPRNYSAAVDAQNVSQPQQQIPPQQSMQPPVQSQPNKNPVASFFKKLKGPTKSSAPLNPVPPDYANRVPEVPPASVAIAVSVPAAFAPAATAPGVQAPGYNMVPQSPPSSQPNLTTRPNGIQQTASIPQTPKSILQPENVTTASASNGVSVQPPQPSLNLPALAQQPQPLIVEVIAQPAVVSQPQQAAVASTSIPESTKTDRPIQDEASEFFNPFPEQQLVVVESNSKPAAEMMMHPLAEPAPAISANANAPLLESPKAEEDPYAVRTKDFAEPSLDERNDTIAKIGPNTAADQAEPSASLPSTLTMVAPPALAAPELSPPALTPPPTNEPNSIVEHKETQEAKVTSSVDTKLNLPVEQQDAQLEKMRRIRERFGMKGLKGFCPVTLRDDRELLDAKPEFQSMYRGQRFHFASEESRIKFEAEPSMYAPAAYGADVVALFCEKEILEGTLDFAAWYKGRLYLFGSQTNYDAFVKSPTKFATPAGIE